MFFSLFQLWEGTTLGVNNINYFLELLLGRLFLLIIFDNTNTLAQLVSHAKIVFPPTNVNYDRHHKFNLFKIITYMISCAKVKFNVVFKTWNKMLWINTLLVKIGSETIILVILLPYNVWRKQSIYKPMKKNGIKCYE